MARKFKRTRKTVRKRVFRRKKMTNRQTGGLQGNGQALLTINRGLGFPMRMRTKLRYNETTSISSSVGVMAVNSFSCNGIFDPNHTGAGHQPMYFDQYMAVYAKYKVLGSKITVELIPQSTSISEPCYVAVWKDDDFAFSGSFPQAIELGVLKNYQVVGGTSRNISRRLYNSWSLKRTFKDSYSAAAVTGSQLANPAEQTGYMIGLQPVNSSGTVTYSMIVTIDYIVDFFELKDTSQS